MIGFQKMIVLGILLLAMLIAVGNAHAVDLWYDFEGDSGQTATDKLTDDGAQDGNFLGNVSVQSAPGIVPWGDQSALLEAPSIIPANEIFSTIEIPGSDSLAENFTLAMHVNNLEDPQGFTRLFSSYGGMGGIEADRIIFDYDPSGVVLELGMRAIINGVAVQPAALPAGLADLGYHHYALTADAGLVTVYLDGVAVASADVGTGYTNAGSTIHIGEDPHDLGGGANEQLIGNVDDILVIDQVLNAAQIADLSSGSTVQSVLGTPTGTIAVNYDFEGDSGTTITDKFTADGSQDGITRVQAGVDTEAANAKLGNASGYFPAAEFPDKFSQIETGVTGTDLGSEFTLSAVINIDGDGYTSGNLTRLFSTYAGSASAAGRLIMDFEPDASTYDIAVRVILPDGTNISTNQAFSYSENHTLTAVYDGSTVKIYIDGAEAISDAAAVGGVADLGEYALMIGEDLAGGVNEQYIGTMDDVLILSRALSAIEVATMHGLGVSAMLDGATLSLLPGDANGDRMVNGTDAATLAANWQTATGATWEMGDFNDDGAVDEIDATILAANWQTSATSAGVPEPGTLALLAGGLLMLFAARRRKA